MSVLTLADAKTHLNEQTSANDVELQSFVDAAEAAIAAQIGPLTPTAKTERVRGGRVLLVSTLPISTLTSVTPVFGSPLDASFLYIDANAGIVSYYASWFPLPYYDVAYTAGRAVSSSAFPDIYQGIKELVRHLWMTQRGSASAAARYSGHGTALDTVSPVPGSAYSWPTRVTELLAPYLLPGAA
jgi:hypothetical protein